MSNQVEKLPEGKQAAIAHIFILTALLVMPGAIWTLIGWVSCFIPLVIFTTIYLFGWRYNNRYNCIAIILAIAISYLLQSIELTMFTIAFIPAGYIVAYSAFMHEKPWLAGSKAAICLALSLFVYFSILLSSSNIGLSEAISGSLNNGIDEVLGIYAHNDSLSSENYAVFEQTLTQMKVIFPIIVPAIFGSIIMLVSWITLVLGNTLLHRIGKKQPWPEYRFWSLPEKLIWIVILSGVMATVFDGPLKLAGINLLILSALVYSFQGLAILVFLLRKWRVPRFFRSIMYIMIVLQSFGTVVLIGFGIADVWFDIRRLQHESTNNTTQIE